ncbi:hypothetical protein GE09DRAFT_95616 [Coniochaeta sp. 2T2.1]|nr:hypothetical protein GE09DRAFT_95616 [Coniochaeta sp. 2T2.1]
MNDDIYPVHYYDDDSMLRSIMVLWSFVFNDVLDAEKLHSSLRRLLEKEGWRKLGGRLRLNAKGKLEVHVPQVFTSERPPVHFTHQVENMTMDQHPVARQLPRSTDQLSVQPTPTELFLALGLRRGGEGVPVTAYDLVNSDEPQLSVHVVSFLDATLVGFLWPHTMMDGMGRTTLIKAWSLVLAGREDEVPKFAGARDDIMATVGTELDSTTPEPWMLKPQIMGRLGKIRMGGRLMWDVARHPQTLERVICVPPATQQFLYAQALDDLQTRSAHGDNKTKPPFVSNSDVLAAWAVRLVGRSQSRPRPLTLCNIVEVRGRLPSVFPRPMTEEAYIQNATARTQVFLSADEVTTRRSLSLGETALKVRQAVAEQATEGQVRAQIRNQRRARAAGESFLLYGDPDAVMMFLTNQTKDGIFRNADFGPAVVGDRRRVGGGSSINPPGTPVYTHTCYLKPNWLTRCAVSFWGKDYEGNVWIQMVLSADVWGKVVRILEETKEAVVSKQAESEPVKARL